MWRLLLVLLILATLTAGAMNWSVRGDSAPADFTFCGRGDHKTLDPGQMSWLQDIRAAYALWEGLYTLDPVTLQPIPGTADRVQIDPAKTVYTFHIRDSARWTNGDPVRSTDFLFAWRRIIEQPGDYTFLHFYIKGAEQYADKYADWVKQADASPGLTNIPPPDYSIVGVKAPDDRTLIVTLKNPTPFFLSLCAFPPFFPLHENSMRPFAVVDPHTGRASSYDEAFTRPPNLVSNGPYRLSLWQFKRKLRYVASDFYWDRTNVKSKIMDEPIIEDALARFRAYYDGQVDWLYEVEGSMIGEMREQGGWPDMHVFPSFGTYFYVLNCLPKLPDGRRNPMADPRVRQALAMSIDKQPIVDNVTRGGEQIASNYVPIKFFADYPSPPGQRYDIAKAQQLLAEAGYPNGRGFPPLSLLFNKETYHGDVALIVRSQWKQNLGIDVDLSGVEIKVFGYRLHNRDFDIARASWYGDYPDPSTFTDKFLSDNDDNNAGWSNPQYDALCAQAAREPDSQKRMKLLAQAEQILLDQAPVIPIFYYTNQYMFRSNVHGIPFDPLMRAMFQPIWVQR